MKNNKILRILGFTLFFPVTAFSQPAVDLGTAASYAVLGGSTITSAGATTLCGDLGLFPGTVVSGSPVLNCGGVSHVNDGPASVAQGDLTTAYNDAASRSG